MHHPTAARDPRAGDDVDSVMPGSRSGEGSTQIWTHMQRDEQRKSGYKLRRQDPATVTDDSHADELETFQRAMYERGLHPALSYLNGRTPFRFTGVYRFNGTLLCNIFLFDRWDPQALQGDDAPMAETFCALVRQAGDVLQVEDGRSDPRFPHMASNPVISYCGALIRDGNGEPFGTLCHFDLRRCEPSHGELSLLQAAAPLVYDFLLPPGS
jgi:hypothetical protein